MVTYRVLAERLGWGDSERFRKILEFLMTPKQAEIVTYLPAAFEEVASKSGLSVEEVRKEIDVLFRKGVLIPRDFRTLEGARFARSTVQFHDATQADRKTEEIYGEKAPQLWELWQDFCEKEWYPGVAEEYAKKEVPSGRVIPAYKAIENIPGITPYDDVREILKVAPLTVVVPCSCRRRTRRTDIAVESCMQFGKSAEYAIERGSGWQLSYDEALKVIDKAEDNGEVHSWPNWQILSYGFMCNCDRVSCEAWAPLVQHGVSIGKRWAKSRFEAVVDQALCDGCQLCVDRCQFDAIDMVKPSASKKYKAVVDPEKCWGCGVCVIKCQTGALSFKLVRPLEHIPTKRPGA
jgi:NAD-dependent dihydropyrimidine dehydrogenase PreA subunit